MRSAQNGRRDRASRAPHRALGCRNDRRSSAVHDRMLPRRLATFIASLLVALPLLASPLQKEMHEVERIRGLSFLHDVDTIAIDRDALPSMLRNQMEKELPYSWEDYIVVLRALHLVDPSTHDVQGALIDLLDQQVLAFYDPDRHVYYS